MSEQYERRLEGEIDRELKSLRELQAPATLAPRVMAAIAARARLAWYQQSWQAWPAPLRFASLVLALAAAGGLCFGLWTLPRTELFSTLAARPAVWLAGIASLWNAVTAVLGAGALVIKQLGTGFIIGCIAAFGLAWAMCLGLGTACVRLAFARR